MISLQNLFEENYIAILLTINLLFLIHCYYDKFFVYVKLNKKLDALYEKNNILMHNIQQYHNKLKTLSETVQYDTQIANNNFDLLKADIDLLHMNCAKNTQYADFVKTIMEKIEKIENIKKQNTEEYHFVKSYIESLSEEFTEKLNKQKAEVTEYTNTNEEKFDEIDEKLYDLKSRIKDINSTMTEKKTYIQIKL